MKKAVTPFWLTDVLNEQKRKEKERAALYEKRLNEWEQKKESLKKSIRKQTKML